MIHDTESDEPVAPVDELRSVYDGAEAMQCLRLSEKLFDTRQQLQDAIAEIQTLKQLLHGK